MTDIPTILLVILVIAFGTSVIGIVSSLLGRSTYRDLVAALDEVNADPRTTDRDRQIAIGISSMATSWTVGAFALTLVTSLGLVLPVFALLRGKRLPPDKRPSGNKVKKTIKESIKEASSPDAQTVKELSGVSIEGSWLESTEILSRIWVLSWKSALYAHPFWVLATIIAFIVLWVPFLAILWLFGRAFGGSSSLDAAALLRSFARVAH